MKEQLRSVGSQNLTGDSFGKIEVAASGSALLGRAGARSISAGSVGAKGGAIGSRTLTEVSRWEDGDSDAMEDLSHGVQESSGRASKSVRKQLDHKSRKTAQRAHDAPASGPPRSTSGRVRSARSARKAQSARSRSAAKLATQTSRESGRVANRAIQGVSRGVSQVVTRGEALVKVITSAGSKAAASLVSSPVGWAVIGSIGAVALVVLLMGGSATALTSALASTQSQSGITDDYEGPIIVGTGWARPANGGITSLFGYRGEIFQGLSTFHDGLDFSGGCGTPIYAANDGVVVETSYDLAGAGTLIVDHGGGVRTAYLHMVNPAALVRVGDTVKAGQQIAYIGSTGYSTGCHLHFEVRLKGTKVDPLPFLREVGVPV